MPEYREIERKYLLNEEEKGMLPHALMQSEPEHIEQYYLNTPDEPYELRIRRSEQAGRIACTATLKKGSPPDRLEMETEVVPSTYSGWLQFAATKPIKKQRRTLEFPRGEWALDDIDVPRLTVLEAEGDVLLPANGTDVTEDSTYTNYALSEHTKEPSDTNLSQTIDYMLEDIEIARKNNRNGRAVIGIAGATASGKTTLAKAFAELIGESARIISQDDYYLGVTAMRAMFGAHYEPNFDDPISMNHRLLAQHLGALRMGQPIERPSYSMATSDPTDETVTINPDETPVIIVEGIHALHHHLQDLYDRTIFVEAPLATRVGRRLERDLREGRGFKPEDNLRYLLEVAEPTYAPHGRWQKRDAGEIFYSR